MDEITAAEGVSNTVTHLVGYDTLMPIDTVTERAAAPIITKYTGVLAAADVEVFTRTTTFAIMQSLRLDRGPSGPVHP